MRRLMAIVVVLGSAVTLAHAQGMLAVASLGSVEAQLAERRAFLTDQRAKQAQLGEQLEALPEQRRALQETLARDVRALYRLRRGGLLPIAGGFEALMGHASRVAHFERLTRRTLARIAETKRSLADLNQQASEVDLQIAATEEELQTLEQTKSSLEQAQAIELSMAPEDPSAAPSLQGAAGPPVYGLSFSQPSPAHREQVERFAEQRGELALPVGGAASIEEVAALAGTGSALTFTAQSGASVRAAASGRVTLAERNAQYGLFVVIEHGERYRTVYGRLGSLEVQPGDALSKSARLGAAGTDAIYFEVRRGRRCQDARSWLGL